MTDEKFETLLEKGNKLLETDMTNLSGLFGPMQLHADLVEFSQEFMKCLKSYIDELEAMDQDETGGNESE